MDKTEVIIMSKQTINFINNTLKHSTLFILLTVTVLGLNGCGLAVKGVAETARGGTSDLLIIEPVQDLGSYESLVIIPFTSSVGGRLNKKFLSHLNGKVADYNSQKELKQQQGGRLQLSGTILHLTDGFYEKQILLQLKFHDVATRKSLGLINVMGEANTIRGLTAAVDSLADSVIELLVDNHFSGIKN
jgi:hypothetical protein